MIDPIAVNPRAYLSRLSRDDSLPLDLARAALALAALDREQVPLGRYLDHLDELAAAVRAACTDARNPEELARRLARVLSEQFAYQGDTKTYDDQQNANLMRVIDRRKGLPVALGILYIHTARAQGWSASGLNFPNHFLIRVEIAEQRVILDPFHGGQILQPHDLRDLLTSMLGAEATLRPEHYHPVPDRIILLRLQNNIKLRHMAENRHAQALEVLDRMLLFAPDQAILWREAGLVNVHLGQHKAALSAFSTYLELPEVPDADRHRIAGVIERLRSRLN